MGFLVFILILSILIIVHEFGHFIVAKKLGVRVERFALGFGKKLFSRKVKDTEYIISAVPLGGYVKLAGDTKDEFTGKPDEYLSQPVRNRSLIVFAGPLLNYILSFICFIFVFYLGYPMLTTEVGGLLDGYPAKKAGLIIGDKIIAVNGKSVNYFEDMQEIIHKDKKGSVDIRIKRDGRELEIAVPTKLEKVDAITGKKQAISLIGIRPTGEIIVAKYGFFASVVNSFERVFSLTVITYEALWHILTGSLSFKDSITGPLGIFYVTSKAAQLGFVAVLHVVAILSVSLAIFNLLPFPVLDGGHLFLLLIEKIRGKALSPKIDEVITKIGFSVIIGFAVIVFFNDLVKFGIIDKVFGKVFKIN